MTRHQPQPSQQSSRPPRFINAVESLEHALQRLEDTLQQRDVMGMMGIRDFREWGVQFSTPGRRKKNPKDVEVGTLTQLAEIMLHPPTQILNGNYLRDEFTMPETNIIMLGLLMMKGEGEDSDDANKDFMNTSSLSPTSNLLPITTLDERKSRYSTLDAAQFYCLQHSCQSRHSASHVQHVDPFRRNDTVWVCA